MIQKTFLLYPEIFRKYYNNVFDDNIATIVLSKKPNKLKNLLHIANNNLKVAFKIIKQRGLSFLFNNKPNISI
ncbi:MAG TPA: hypothetical protein DC057_01550 [Spirochaetia bacterium]|nr:hypothetical protein [Spirochaetia bacterium]